MGISRTEAAGIRFDVLFQMKSVAGSFYFMGVVLCLRIRWAQTGRKESKGRSGISARENAGIVT